MIGLAQVRDGWQVGTLLRGEPRSLRESIERWNAGRLVRSALVIVVGAGLYGAAMGCWRAPKQALFVAIKFPLIIVLTTLANALLNSMLAPLLGLKITFRQSSAAILMSFVMASAILGSFSPLVLFLVWNAPPLTSGSAALRLTYNSILLMHVSIIALSGTVANLRLFQLLRELSENTMVARRVLAAWLTCNLFFGSQVSWVLRPFIGAPELSVQFLRPTAFQGNFYETVFNSCMTIINSNF